MIGLLRALGDKGERALRRSVWAFAGAGFIVLGLGFAGGALIELLARFVPHYAALGVGAVTLLMAGGFCFVRVGQHRDADNTPPASAAASASVQALGEGDWRSALNLALVEEAREHPARAAALAALAGLVLGAIEGFDAPRAGKSPIL
jgi:hypothetical protein